jgi:Co/Zn/Cd efflux system component
MESYQNHDGTESAIRERDAANKNAKEPQEVVTNEYVLNVAFWTFIGFMGIESVFAIIAGSRSMLVDAEAMSVDALTYLFNLHAERIKHRPYSKEELEMPAQARDYRRELSRLYLELVPPLISVCTLIVVTVLATRDAYDSLRQDGAEGEDDVDVNIMIIFSGLNLLLDVVNVFCFARAHQTFGLSDFKRESITSSVRQNPVGAVELESLLTDGDQNNHRVKPSSSFEDSEGGVLMNLNMCSAWTHVCADTLRSVAVLIAATVSYFFGDFLPGAVADSMAAIVVSIIILISLIPLLRGLYITARHIISLSLDPSRPI